MTSSDADTPWDRLTISSKRAMRWAAAVAEARAPKTSADALDLLAGIMLAHPVDSPARQVGEHFDIPPGAVLIRDGVPVPDADALLAAYRRLPPDPELPLGPEVRLVISHTTSLPEEPDGLVSLRMLFGALLGTHNAASSALREQLARRGVSADLVLGSYNEFLRGRESYAEFLRRRHPYRPPAVGLPTFQPDQPRARRPPADRNADPPDLLDIGAEVDAFAYLISSKRLAPPLAVGLFGDWGGGKSYFLRSVQRRVDDLLDTARATGRPADDLPFYPGIVQVEYNAWQYVEGDLWSSLLEHLFRNLATVNGDDDLLAQRQRAVIDQIRQTGDSHDTASLERARLEEKRQVAAAEVQRREREREVRLAELEYRRRQIQPRIVVRDEVLKAVAAVVERAGLEDVATESEGLQDELNSAADTWRRAGAVLGPLRKGGWSYLVALVGLLALVPGVAWVFDHLDFSAVTTAAGALATLLAALAGHVRLGNRFVSKRLDEIADARAKLDAELADGRKRLDAELAEARQALAVADNKLETATSDERRLAADVAGLEVTLAKTTPSRVLVEFISERLGSSDYRSRLGVPALVRRDLARLSNLIQQRHEDRDRTDEHGIDRIVLYIDDLDRCPTRLVVDVLQAVHLLLAFPLFVVVLAVDARWLAKSLSDHYRQLEGTDADPEDFIEKIFQIPFWVRPLEPAVRRHMVNGLMSPSVSPDDSSHDATRGPEPAAQDISTEDLREFHDLIRRLGNTTSADPIEAATLKIKQAELEWIERVAPLLGATPRAVKRFANVYLLLRSVGRARGWPEPTDGKVIVLLALATGAPELTGPLFLAIERATQDPLVMRDALEALDGRRGTDALLRWLDDEPTADALNLAGMTDWIELIRRFRFHR